MSGHSVRQRVVSTLRRAKSTSKEDMEETGLDINP
jgi:hypothetical protein